MLNISKLAWRKIRARVVTLGGSFAAVLLLIPTNKNWIGHLIDAGVHGLSVPAWAAATIPAGSAIVTALAGIVATKVGDPDSLRFFEHGLFASVFGKTPATAAAVSTDPPPPEFIPRPGMFATQAAATHADDASALDARMAEMFAGSAAVEVTDHPPDLVGPHGANTAEEMN